MHKFFIFLSFILLFCVLGCQSTKTIHPSATKLIETIPQTKESTVNIQPTHTATLSPSLTGTPTLVPTWTPLPTLEDRFDIVESLMMTNKGCQLPCWWGITPGKTTWTETRQFLEQFAFISSASFSTSSQIGSSTYVAYFWNPGTDDSNGAIITTFDGIVQTIRIDPETSRYSFTLDQLLSNYGPPSSVLVRKSNFSSEKWLSYSVVLLYQEKRFLANFSFSAAATENVTEACLQRGPHIDIWSPKEDWTLSWIQQTIEYQNKRPFKSLEEVAEIDEEEFFMMFKSYSSEKCFGIQSDF